MKPSRREAIAALVGLPALSSFLASCREAPERPPFGGVIAGADVLRGHRIRTGELLTRPVARRESVGVAILGAGISGLSAAWTFSRAGFTDFRLYELEDDPGGNARSGQNAVSAFPWGAHYVPVPVYGNAALETLLSEVGALTGRTPDGEPEWAEEMLCAEPEERLFFRGIWYEGLYPRAGASREDREELSRFEREMLRFAALRDAKGRRAFALPRRRSSDDAEWTALDRISMREWLTRERLLGRAPLLVRRVRHPRRLRLLARRHLRLGRHPLLRLAPARGLAGRPLRGARRVPDLARGERPPRETPREERRQPDRDRRRRLRRRPEGRRRHASAGSTCRGTRSSR